MRRRADIARARALARSFSMAFIKGVDEAILEFVVYALAYFWAALAISISHYGANAIAGLFACFAMVLSIRSAIKTTRRLETKFDAAEMERRARKVVGEMLTERDFDPNDLARRLAVSLGYDVGQVSAVRITDADGNPVERRKH